MPLSTHWLCFILMGDFYVIIEVLEALHMKWEPLGNTLCSFIGGFFSPNIMTLIVRAASLEEARKAVSISWDERSLMGSLGYSKAQSRGVSWWRLFWSSTQRDTSMQPSNSERGTVMFLCSFS